MGQIPLYGVTSAPQFDFLQFARVIFAAQQGTLLELGIGPIVTAGLLMQLLKGSDLIKLNFKNPDDRSLFTSATKIVTIIVIIAEGALYGVSVYGHLLASPTLIPILILQLVGSSIIVMFLDELVQKGWGLGFRNKSFHYGRRCSGDFVESVQPGACGGWSSRNISIPHRFSYSWRFVPSIFPSWPASSIFGLIVTSTVLLCLYMCRGFTLTYQLSQQNTEDSLRYILSNCYIHQIFRSYYPLLCLLTRYLWDRCYGLTTTQKTLILL